MIRELGFWLVGFLIKRKNVIDHLSLLIVFLNKKLLSADILAARAKKVFGKKKNYWRLICLILLNHN